ncbi:MAG: c-type cytochrome [Verrucomicrobiota bacterium]
MKTLGTLLLLASSLLAQQGNREGHDNMNPVVPEELIPPAPVLSVEDALKTFELAEGFTIEPVAAEPLVEKPVDLKFDGNGRIWVVEMRGYMPDVDGNDEHLPQGRIAVLEDTNNDGRADKRTIFLDNIHLPRAIALVKDGVLIGDQTQLYFCGRNGIQRTSEPIVVDEKYAPAGNVEHKPNALMPHLNNWLYCAKGEFRYQWKNGNLHKDSTQFRGQWGLSMDNFGRIYHTNNSVILRGDRLLPDVLESFPKAKLKPNTSTILGSNRVYPSRVTPGVNRAYIAKINGYDKDTLDPKTHKLINASAVAGLAYYRGDQFPESWNDVAFSTESVVNLVKATRVTADGLNLSGEHVFADKEFLTSTDERFRPVNIHTAPDGSLYLVDYYHGIIQHKTYMTSYLRAQTLSRGLEKPSYELGRIYRIRHKDKPLGPQPQLLNAPSKELVETLAHPNGWWRDTAQRLLVERNDPSTIQPLKNNLRNHPNELTRIHSLWALEGLDQMDHQDILATVSHENSSALQTHGLTAALSLPPDQVSSSKGAIACAKAPHLEPYLTRFIVANFSEEPQIILSTFGTYTQQKAPFVVDAAATSLFSKNITDFPKTKTKLDSHLANFKRNQKQLTPEQRLSGDHLASFKRGETVYSIAACVGCHGADGLGLPNLGPPLDQSEWVTGHPDRLAKILLHGLQGPITVNGKKYNPAAAMPGLSFNPTITDQNLADVMTYVRANWSNKAPLVTESQVKAVREATKDRNGRLYTADELQ